MHHSEQTPTSAPDDTGLQHRREQYARELRARFADYKRWAITNWPVNEQALTDTAFIAAERELELMTGTMLHPGSKPDGPDPASAATDAQFEDVTPAPWP